MTVFEFNQEIVIAAQICHNEVRSEKTKCDFAPHSQTLLSGVDEVDPAEECSEMSMGAEEWQDVAPFVQRPRIE
ncbi:MAG: hypothetical protein U0841_03230 [Chloroflexia bacterium]